MKNFLAGCIILVIASSCSVSKNYNPAKKFSPAELREDYTLFRNILEESHPSLYWYTPKDSMDHYFDWGASRLADSMQEYQFRNVLSYVLSKVHCGHTSVRPSKAASGASRIRRVSFPLNVKMWGDTTIVVSSLNRDDSIITRGVLLRSIEGRSMKKITDSLFNHLSTDGFNKTHKYQTLSNSGVFRNMYASIFGLRSKLNVEYIDTSGLLKRTWLTIYNPEKDSTSSRPPMPKVSKRERKKYMLESQRSFYIDTALKTGFLELNSFSKKYKLRGFFRRSFKKMRKEKIKNLVIDIRGNGGGNVTLSNLLTKYIADSPFKIADSLYAVANKSKYREYHDHYLLNRLFFIFLTRKREDGLYHFRHFENRYFKPKDKNHFKGTAYILTGGNTFSAAALFAKAVKDQENVVIVGEETGGSAYGNSAWLIPDITLPNTKVRFRLPLFRLVIDKDATKGRGILPEVEVVPSVKAIRRNRDYKTDRVVEMIKNKQ